jgi:hypothetical protein
MAMAPHKVLAEFLSAGKRIKPPGEWAPPNEATAARLIAAKCLRAPRAAAAQIAGADIVPQIDQGDDSSESVAKVAADGDESAPAPGVMTGQILAEEEVRQTKRRRRGRRGG